MLQNMVAAAVNTDPKVAEGNDLLIVLWIFGSARKTMARQRTCTSELFLTLEYGRVTVKGIVHDFPHRAIVVIMSRSR